jgi:hypothetical protein
LPEALSRLLGQCYAQSFEAPNGEDEIGICIPKLNTAPTLGTLQIPLFAAGRLANQIGSGGYSADRFFRRKLTRWLAEVKAFWPHCPAQISPDGQTRIVNSSRKRVVS